MSPAVERVCADNPGIVEAACGFDRSLGMGDPFLPEEAIREEDFSTEHPSAGPPSRFPAPHGDPGRPAHHALPPSTGSCPAIGLIWSIRDRATFVELTRRGRRVSSGPLTVVHLPEKLENPSIAGDSGSSTFRPRVAFAVPRAAGSAVVRNQFRRRIRAIAAHRASDGQMAAGAWLFIGRPGVADMSFDQLDHAVTESVNSLSGHRVDS